MDFRFILLIFLLLDLGLEVVIGMDPKPDSLLRFNSKSNFELGSDSGAKYREVFSNKVIFQKMGYMATTITDVSIAIDVPIYVALNYNANQTEYLQNSLNSTLVSRTKLRVSHYTSELDKFNYASLSKEIDYTVSFHFNFSFLSDFLFNLLT
jgi:hypothetical protein